jgi:prepilin-type N-terminal cleavage/methylation domain-containing protein
MSQVKTQLRRAFTLVEMLIAMALTLILVYAVAEFYAYVGTAVRDGRALIEMGSQLRAAAQQLHNDLNSLTLRPEPWIDPATSPGYFTIYEGPRSDTYPDAAGTDISVDSNNNQIPDAMEIPSASGVLAGTTLVGDGDDILAMTIQARDVPFQGQVWNGSQYVTVTSQYAEVIWYTTFTDLNGNDTWDINEPRFLCRRQLLILPQLGNLPMPGSLADFYGTAEVSFRLNPSGQPVANSLADLSLRHNRFGCQQANPAYPSLFQINPTSWPSITYYSMKADREGEDRLLPNLLAFDVRVYDPTAPVHQDANGTTALAPGDMGFGNGSTPIGLGAWVDLGYNRTPLSNPVNSHFSGSPAPVFMSTAAPYNFVFWDTWATTYELPNLGLGSAFTGTGFPGTGQAFNGLDDNGQFGVDDATERQTQPPYAAPLRGVQVRVRIYEPQTRQARQVTVGADFVAE